MELLSAAGARAIRKAKATLAAQSDETHVALLRDEPRS